MTIPEPILEVILDVFNDASTPAQRELLQRWLDEDPRHKTSYDELCVTLYAAKWSGQNHISDTGWAVLMAKYRRRKTMRLLRPVAAAACVLLAAGMWWLMPSRVAPDGVLAALTDSASKEVMLLLSDGEKITLTGRTGEMTDNGLVFTADSSRLVYGDDSQPVASEQRYHTVIVPRGGDFRLTLSDGTEVILNSGTELRFPVRFAGGVRELHLDGEACFTVKRDEHKPFIVHTGRFDVEVLGTMFNVAAYDGDTHPSVTLVNGSVKVRNERHENLLSPGQQYELDVAAESSRVTVVDTDMYTAWTRGVQIFDAMPLEQLMVRLGRWFDIRYRFGDEAMKHKRFSGAVRKTDDIQTVIRQISEMTGQPFRQVDGVIVIGGK